jgi:ApaG protein
LNEDTGVVETAAQNYHVSVQGTAAYVADQSDPDQQRFVFAYTIVIRNEGSVGARLLSRHWIIADADGEVQEVRGDGVVGERPFLGPGGEYRYTSGSLLTTPVGSMRGSYQMLAADGHRFEAEIPAMTLAVPGSLH